MSLLDGTFLLHIKNRDNSLFCLLSLFLLRDSDFATKYCDDVPESCCYLLTALVLVVMSYFFTHHYKYTQRIIMMKIMILCDYEEIMNEIILV